MIYYIHIGTHTCFSRCFSFQDVPLADGTPTFWPTAHAPPTTGFGASGSPVLRAALLQDVAPFCASVIGSEEAPLTPPALASAATAVAAATITVVATMLVSGGGACSCCRGARQLSGVMIGILAVVLACEAALSAMDGLLSETMVVMLMRCC